MIDIAFIDKAIARTDRLHAQLRAVSTFISIRHQLDYIRSVLTGDTNER